MISQKKSTIYWRNSDRINAKIEKIRELGAGRAARAELVKVSIEGREPFYCVEKVFLPGFLTRFIYACFFQSPFPYRYDRNAIGAAYHRRVVASYILRAETKINEPVATPIYTRWDEERKAYVLAAKWIEGRGIKPQKADQWIARRKLYNYVARPFLKLFGKKIHHRLPPHEEILDLVALMRKKEGIFKKSGLIASGWQTAPASFVSTSNLLKTHTGYVLVDLESGIPAVLIPYYLRKSIIYKKFPYFDDVESSELFSYLREKRADIIRVIGIHDYKDLMEEADKLCNSVDKWKESETAIFRNLFSLIFDYSKRSVIIESRANIWMKCGYIDDDCYAKIVKTGRLYSRPVFFLGILPFAGNFLRKLTGHHEFRNSVQSFIKDKRVRKLVVENYIIEHIERWLNEKRIPEGFISQAFNFRFIKNLFYGKFYSPMVHRFMTDKVYRKKFRRNVHLFLISGRFQLEYARFIIYRTLLDWKKEGRMKEKDFQNITIQINSPNTQEYVRVFGLHALLKFFTPLTFSIKVAGIGWYLKTFSELFPLLEPKIILSYGILSAFLKTALINPFAILMMVNTSLWRTLITLWRMLSVKRRHIHYKGALFFGMIPTLGTLAYPVQIYATAKDLSIFMMRHIFSKVGQKIPIYGGKDSRTEMWLIKATNFIIEFFEIIKWFWRKTFKPVLQFFTKPFQGKRKKRKTPEIPKCKYSDEVDEIIGKMWRSLDDGMDYSDLNKALMIVEKNNGAV